MADHRPWLKLWKTAYNDPSLARLTMQDMGRWVRLLLFVGLTGEDGSTTLEGGLSSMSGCLKLRGQKAIQEALERLPGVRVERAEFPSSAVTITFVKWTKYQKDSSAARTRAWRQGKRNCDGSTASPVTTNPRHRGPLGDDARVDKNRQEPPNPLLHDPFDTTPKDADATDPAHLRFNIPD